MDKTERPSFYAIIPANVRYSAELTANAKLLYGEVTALANKTGTCWAGNKYFSELYAVAPTTISEWVRQLEAAGFIRTKKLGTGQRGIELAHPVRENPKPSSGKAEDPVRENPKHNNTSNTTKNNEGILDWEKKDNAGKYQAETCALLDNLIVLVNPKEKATAERLRVLNGRRKDYTVDEIIAAARAFSKSQWHKDNKQMSIDNLLAPSKFGRWFEQGIPDAGNGTIITQPSLSDQDKMVEERMGV